MRKIAYAAFVSALFTMFGGSWYFLCTMFDALSHGGDVGKAVVDTFFGCLLCWAMFTYIVYQIQQMFDELNQAGRRDTEEHRQRETQDRQNQPTRNNEIGSNKPGDNTPG